MNVAEVARGSYAYDAAGRRTVVGGGYARTGVPQAASSATYNVNNQLTNWKGATLTYDANGNLTSDGTNTYTWNARNQLVSISGGVNASFQYDAFGRRVSKTIGGTTQFLYDGANPVQEISGSSASANLLTGGVDEYFQRTDSAGARSFLTDALGSTLALADSTGTLQTSYTFEPFGNTSTTGASTTNSFAFTGRELDPTGLYFYRARYYSSQLQRFVSEDPLDFDGGDSNLYAYVSNSPGNLVDPSGEWPSHHYHCDLLGNCPIDRRKPPTAGRKSLLCRAVSGYCSLQPDVATAGVGLDVGLFIAAGFSGGLAANGSSGELALTGTLTINVGLIAPDVYAYTGSVFRAPTNASLNSSFAHPDAPQITVAGERFGVSATPNSLQFTSGPSLSPVTVALGGSVTKATPSIPYLGYLLDPVRAACKLITGK